MLNYFASQDGKPDALVLIGEDGCNNCGATLIRILGFYGRVATPGQCRLKGNFIAQIAERGLLGSGPSCAV